MNSDIITLPIKISQDVKFSDKILSDAIDEYNNLFMNETKFGFHGFETEQDSEISHEVLSIIYVDDASVFGTIKILDTPKGNFIRKFIQSMGIVELHFMFDYSSTGILCIKSLNIMEKYDYE